MARQRVSKGNVIIKKDEKVKAVFDALSDDITELNFKNKFKELFPEAWDRIVKRYEEHERLTKKGKPHPMPEPEKYLSNIYNTNKGKYKSS